LKNTIIALYLISTVFFSNALASDKLVFLGAEYPPYEYKENLELKGLSIDLLHEIFSLLKSPKNEIKLIPWKRAYEMALIHKNTVVFSTLRTKEREKSFYWVGPIYTESFGLFKLEERQDIKINTLKDAKKYTIGTISGTASEKLLLSKGFTNKEHLSSVTYADQNIRMLLFNRVDLIVSSEAQVAFALKNTKGNLKKVSNAYEIDNKNIGYFAFNIKTNKDLINKFRRAYDLVIENGTYQRLLIKYQN
jgi:polar amino acid transport system substrate-binding protein